MNKLDTKLIQLANKCIKFRKYEYVEMIIKKLLQNRGNNPEVLREIGILFYKMGNKEAALTLVKRSFILEKSVKTLQLMAELNLECLNYEDAAIEFEELTKHVEEEEIYGKCIMAYQELGLRSEAVRIAKLAVERFNTPSIHTVLFHNYIYFGMGEEARECCKEIERKFPNTPAVYNSKAFLCEAIDNDYDNAKKYFKKAAKLGLIDAYYNLGSCCKNNEDFGNAEIYLKKLISLKPDSNMDYNYTLGSVYMAQRKLRLGYKYYYNRDHAKQVRIQNKNKMWDGKDYPDEILYVSAEQGLGDNMQFVRYLPLAAKKFKKVIYASPANIFELLKNSFKKYPNIEIVLRGEVMRYNKLALIMDLPYIMKMTFHNIPYIKQYLTSDKEKQKYFNKEFFAGKTGLNIGLCWKANGMGLRDAMYRTIDAPYYFKHLFELSNINYYSLQFGDIFDLREKYPQIIDLTPEIKNFDDTAAALMNLDIMITVDTGVAHLAGALGIKTYLLLCHAPDWRWFDNTSKTEWYPSIRIIRQKDRRTWEDVSQKLYEYVSDDVKKYTRKNAGKL